MVLREMLTMCVPYAQINPMNVGWTVSTIYQDFNTLKLGIAHPTKGKMYEQTVKNNQ